MFQIFIFIHPIIKNPIIKNPIIKNPIIKNPIIKNPIIKNPIIKKPNNYFNLFLIFKLIFDKSSFLMEFFFY